MLHLFLALGLHLYLVYPWLDLPAHLSGGLAMAYFLWRAMLCAGEAGVLGEPSPPVTIVMVFALTCTATVFWEFAEWISDHYLGTRSQLGLDDTLKDILMGLVGCLIFLIFKVGVRRQERAA